MQCLLPHVSEISYNISFQLVLKMSCNLISFSYLDAMQSLSLTVLIPRSICSPFDLNFMQVNIIRLISDHSDFISQTYLNLFPCHSLAKVYVNHTYAHCIMHMRVEQLITKCRDNRLNTKE